MNLTGMNNSCLRYDPYQDDMRTVKITTIIILSVFGFIGNTLVITLAAKFAVRKNLHHLIINMCVADIIVIFITGLPSLTVYWNYELWTFTNKSNDITCKGFAFIRLAVSLISFNTLLIISIERCRATRLTIHRSQSHTLVRRILILIFSWLLSFGVASHALLIFKVVPKSIGLLKCLPFFEYEAFGILLGTFCLIVGMFISMIIINVLTLRSLSRPQPIDEHLSEAQRRNRSQKTQKIVAMILCSLFLCFYAIFLSQR